MHKSATKCNKTLGKWCKNKHGASKIMDTLETYHGACQNDIKMCVFDLAKTHQVKNKKKNTYVISKGNNLGANRPTVLNKWNINS
jgi:hypothetical protein